MQIASFAASALLIVATAGTMANAFAQAGAPAGLDRILRGVQPGMRLEAFRDAHPRAVPLEAPVEQQQAPADTAEVTMTESIERDPLLGLECHANFGFREGVLREFVVLWGGEQEEVKKDLKPFLQACVWKHGPAYRRDVMQVNPRSETPPMVPVLVWETEQGRYIASLAWNPESQRAPGTLTYALYAPGDPFLDIVLLSDELAPEVVKDVFAEIQPILNELASVGSVAPEAAQP